MILARIVPGLLLIRCVLASMASEPPTLERDCASHERRFPSCHCSDGVVAGRAAFADDVTFLQASLKSGCGTVPDFDGQAVDSLIAGHKGILLIGMEHMRCTQAVEDALSSTGASYDVRYFDSATGTPGQPLPDNAAPLWKWLHCKYPNDSNMHSYLFVNGTFEGEGFTAANKIRTGSLLQAAKGKSCEEKFPTESQLVEAYMYNSSNRVLLFGWQGCPCTGIAEARFAAQSLCYDGRTWADPGSKLMKYLQCKTGPEHHSFIYFRDSSGSFQFFGNGFGIAEDQLPSAQLTRTISTSKATTSCMQATVAFNVYGGPLEECRLPSDEAAGRGSWMDDGKCSETMGGIHQICIQAGTLPADFSMNTYQSSDWSKSRTNNSHCICVGAWSTYMTEEEKHVKQTQQITPRCKSIPETVLSKSYMSHWKDWNGFHANVAKGLRELVSRCMTVDDSKLKCGLKTRFEKLLAEEDVLAKASEFTQVRGTMQSLRCE